MRSCLQSCGDYAAESGEKKEANRLSGIGMLLYQGVIAFEIWTGVKAPVLVMKNALSRQIAERS